MRVVIGLALVLAATALHGAETTPERKATTGQTPQAIEERADGRLRADQPRPRAMAVPADSTLQVFKVADAQAFDIAEALNPKRAADPKNIPDPAKKAPSAEATRAPEAAKPLDKKQKKAMGIAQQEVLVVADALSATDELRPKPGQPIYYIYRQGKYDIGATIAGTKMPKPEEIETAVVAELAKQGFVRTQVGGPIPAIFVLAIWGESNFDAPDGVAPSEVMEQRRDRAVVQNLMGGRKNTRSLTDDEKVGYAMSEDRYYLTLGAYDALTYKTERRMLWRTSMSIEFRKHNFSEMLPVMLASAGPSFGVSVAEPNFLDDRDRREAEVKIGEAVVVPDPVSVPEKK